MRYIIAIVIGLFTVDGHTQHTVKAEMDPSQGQDIEVVQIIPKKGPVGKYERIEFGLKLPQRLTDMVLSHEKGNGINPFNPKEILVYAVFTPNGDEFTSRRVEGFFYKEYGRDVSRGRYIKKHTEHFWRVRFAPKAVGDWTVDFFCVAGDKVYSTKGVTFSSEESNKPGFLVKGESGEISDRYLRFSNGAPFFAIGENLAWAYDGGYLKADHHMTMVTWMKELAANGGNYARVWLRNQNYGIEHESLGNYHGRMNNAWELDQLIEVAESLGIYLQLHVLTDEFTGDGGWPTENQWKNNPYHKELGLKEPIEFYHDSTAKEYFQRRLRYYVARYGYSTHIAAWEIVTEPESVSNYYGSKEDKMKFWEWTKQMNYFLSVILDVHQLTMISFREDEAAVETDFWEYTHLDIASANRYARSYGENWHNKYEVVKKIHKEKPTLPYIWSEYGAHTYGTLDMCSDISFHNTIWASSFHGGFGTGLQWWWDVVTHKKQYVDNFAPLAKFFSDIDLTEKNYTAERWDDRTFQYFAKVRTFYLLSEDKKRVYGWAHNTDYWWPHLYEENECVRLALDSLNGHHTDPNDNSNYGWSIREKDKKPPQMLEGKKIKIKGLDGGSIYIVEWYDTHHDGKRLFEEVVKANMFGTIKITFPQSVDYPNGDFAYKIRKNTANIEYL